MDDLVQPQSYTFAAPPDELQLASGDRLGPITVVYETYGRLNAAGDNAILVLHALTGDAHLAGVYPGQQRSTGWWYQLVGPGRVLDTRRYFVVCSNVLGGCYGTTGPTATNPAAGCPYALSFPRVTIRDMVRVQRELLRHLGVQQLVTAIGGSMGGMQALEWAVTYPDMLQSAIPIATSARMSPQGIAFNEVQRQAIYLDPGWRNGDYYPGPGPGQGLALARMIGTITYKSDQSWNIKFGRTQPEAVDDSYWGCHYEVESYLRYQGQKLVTRFDANSYLYMTRAMDYHDIVCGYGSLEEALDRVSARVLMVGISSDFLYPTYQQREVAEVLTRQGKQAEYQEINSPYGHDAFLIEFNQMTTMLRRFLGTIKESGIGKLTINKESGIRNQESE